MAFETISLHLHQRFLQRHLRGVQNNLEWDFAAPRVFGTSHGRFLNGFAFCEYDMNSIAFSHMLDVIVTSHSIDTTRCLARPLQPLRPLAQLARGYPS